MMVKKQVVLESPRTPSPLAGEGGGEGASRLRAYVPLAREKQNLAYAKSMRSLATDAEKAMWRLLRAKRLSGHKFRRQVPIDQYIVDFVCLEHRLIIELDGGQHAEDRKAYDDARTRYLEAQNFRVLRFWNHDVLSNADGVLKAILSEIARPLSPSLSRTPPFIPPVNGGDKGGAGRGGPPAARMAHNCEVADA